MGIVAQLIGTLLLVGFMLKYWWLIALVVLAAVAAWKYVPKVWAGRQAALGAEQRRHAAIAARADQQHQWVLAGDPRAPTAPSSPARNRVEPGRAGIRAAPHFLKGRVASFVADGPEANGAR